VGAQIDTEDLADVLVALLVRGGLDPEGKSAVGRNAEITGRLAGDDVIDGPHLGRRHGRHGGRPDGDGKEQHGRQQQDESAHGGELRELGRRREPYGK
jgi:hypothetical protein